MIDERLAQPILVVDDEESTLRATRRTLRSHGYSSVETCADSTEVEARLQNRRYALVLLDLLMPGLSGEEVLAIVREQHPSLPVIVLTALHDVQAVVSCMRLGASDYLLKPVDPALLVSTIERALEKRALEYEAARLREQFFDDELRSPEHFDSIITADPGMLRLFAYLEAISRGSQPVLVLGETGTGKELVARALHEASGRSGPFVAVNLAGLDDTIFSDTLFGHAPGAFTDARKTRKGMIEQAGEGTLFLDEIGDLHENSQIKLLRLLQQREFYALGSDEPKYLRARVIAATHSDPSRLRSDLYYRLRSYQVRLPPLRERTGDLPVLLDHFLALAARDLEVNPPRVADGLCELLAGHSFPGNVRELQALVFDAVARHGASEGELGREAFSALLADESAGAGTNGSKSIGRCVFPPDMPTLRDVERDAVAEALRRTDGNQSAAARMLGVSRPTIARYVRMLRLGGSGAQAESAG